VEELSKHYKEAIVTMKSTYRNFRQVRQEGKRVVNSEIPLWMSL